MLLSIEVDRHAEKPVIRPDGIFPFSRMGGYYLSLLVIRLPLSANQVTFISMLVGLSGAGLLSLGDALLNIYGTLLLVLCYMLDYCDGVVARLKNQCSPAGAAFDDFVDWLVDTAILACLGWGVTRSDGNDLWMWLGFAAALGSTVDYAIDWVRINRFRQPEQKDDVEDNDGAVPETFKQKLFYYLHTASRAEFCFILLGLAVFDVMWVILPLAAIGAQAFWLGDLFRKRD